VVDVRQSGRRTPRAAGQLLRPSARGSHLLRIQLNLNSSVHRITQLNSQMCPGVALVEL